VTVTPAGAVPLQVALRSTMPLAPLVDCRVIWEVFIEELISAKDAGEAEAVKSRLPVITTARFTDLVTPPELVPVTVKVKVPSEGDAEAETVRVAVTGPIDGTFRLVGVSVTVTPAGAVPLQAAPSCTMSLTPLVDLRVICEVFVEESISARDAGEAEAVNSKLLAITIERLVDFGTPLALLPVIIKVKVPSEGDAVAEMVSVAETPPIAGTVRLVGVSVTVTPAGLVPLQSELSSTMSLTPLTERRMISEVLV
jgi:hypothetical protein